MSDEFIDEIGPGEDAIDAHEVEALPDLEPKAGGLGILKMRPYQTEAVDCIYESWREHDAVVVVLATGMGKTVVAAETILRWPGVGRILVIAHVQELIYQARDTIARHTDDIPSIEMGMHSEVRDGHPVLDRSRVLVASIQSLGKRLKKFRPDDFDVIIVDEFHHAASDSYRRLWDWLKTGNPLIKLLGITATPNRADGTSIACIAQHCAFKMGIREGIDGGWLVPIRQKYIVVDGLDFSKCHTVAKDLNQGDLEEAMLGAVENDSMTPEELQEAIEKQEAMLHRVAAPTVKEAEGRSGIVYCVTVAHAEKMAEVLRRYPGVTAELVHGGTPDQERKELLKRFKSGALQFLVNVGVATEGFDAPSAQVIVMARPTKSTSLYTQMVGRASRPLAGLVDRYDTPELRQEAIANSLKTHALVLDFVGNSGKHKLVSTADVLAGDMPPEFVRAAMDEMAETGEAADIRAKAWQKKQEHDEELKRAQEREAKEREERRKEMIARDEARRARIRAEAQHRSRDINPFDMSDVAPERSQGTYRGGSSDAQIGFLESLGVPRETSMKWSKGQAGAVLTDLKNRTGGAYIMRYGKHKGKALNKIDFGYLKWAGENMQNAEFQTNLEQYRRELRDKKGQAT